MFHARWFEYYLLGCLIVQKNVSSEPDANDLISMFGN